MPATANDIVDYYVSLFHRGDEKGLAYIFEKLFPLLLFYANERLKDKPLAEEIVSTAFVKGWNKHYKLDSFPGIRAYLRKIIERDCKRAIDAKKKIAGEKHSSENACYETPLHSMIKAETINILHSALKKLPPGMRVVMETIYIEGKSPSETAKMLNISTSAVDTHKKRGILALLKLLPPQSFYILSLAFPLLLRFF